MHPLTASSTAPTTPGAEHSAAIDALTAAKLRSEFARDGSSVFVHAPRPGTFVSSALRSKVFGLAMTPRPADQNVLVTVARRADENVAEIGISISEWPSRFDLDADELRRLAERLIDAAHDIEAHPAAALAAEQGGAA